MSKVQITLKDKESGYERTFIEDYHEATEFLWEEGNYSCDCNRSLFLWNWDDKKEHELDCNIGDNRIELIEFKIIK